MLRRIPRNRDELTDYRELRCGGQRPRGGRAGARNRARMQLTEEWKPKLHRAGRRLAAARASPHPTQKETAGPGQGP
jgi:hypothetical protein